MTVIPELINLANGSAQHGDTLAVKICRDAIAEIEQLQGIVAVAIQWRSAELHHAACRLDIREGNIEKAEDKKLKQTSALHITLDKYRRSTREAAEAAKEK